MKTYWRESSGGLRRWLGAWSKSPTRKGWGSLACLTWRSLRGDFINAYKCLEGGARLFSRSSLIWGWQSSGTGCPGGLWILLLWRYSKPARTRSCAACSGWPCFGRGVGLDDPQRSLPTPATLWSWKTRKRGKHLFFYRTLSLDNH